MISKHTAPILAALGGLSVPFSDGRLPNGTNPPYVVGYISVTTPEAVSLEEVADRVTCTVITHSVGANADAARIVADQVVAVLLGLRPVVPNRDCGWVRLIDDEPMRRDEESLQPRLSLIHVWQYTSVPA
ncbi:hypothetical protein [Actinoplanes palleronii]|uniref:DUF3168 domain-containing protein n=1 Tax=Actinoplanes palleronii TaxID=113570 RepID=A0ABQ4BJ70_9ACTN|nr:hypothetical protein [Actinoplanes palleronii]GIE70732.1 hypothetical protein Apa02nite_068400 [Actinoplanes palleronii]